MTRLDACLFEPFGDTDRASKADIYPVHPAAPYGAAEREQIHHHLSTRQSRRVPQIIPQIKSAPTGGKDIQTGG